MLKRAAYLFLLCILSCTAFGDELVSGLMESWKSYEAKVAEGAGLDERISVLSSILDAYKDSGIDLSTVEDERDLLDSWRFYKQQAAEGAGIEQRINILDRILGKYSGKNIDLKEVKNELEFTIFEFEDSVSYVEERSDSNICDIILKVERKYLN